MLTLERNRLMSRKLEDLEPEFEKKIKVLVANCALRGITIVPYLTLRTPMEQARLWRQGRGTATINTKIRELRGLGCNFLADCIEKAGPQNGNRITNALPGMSWHQYGLACDLYWEKAKGVVCWNHNELDKNGLNGYKVMHEEAGKLGLTVVTLGMGQVDWPHVQMPEASPIKDWKAIDEAMKKRFGNTL